MLAVFREAYSPDKIMPDVEIHQATYKVNKDRSDEILKKLGRNGWDCLEECVLKNVEGIVL